MCDSGINENTFCNTSLNYSNVASSYQTFEFELYK